MNIQEIERRTGVPKQNIRFYEKEGLISPDRNVENGYREFSEEDVERIKLVKMFRKLDFPLSKISGLLDGQLDLAETVEEQIKKLEDKSKELELCIGFCRELKQEAVIANIQADSYLREMEERERSGNRFFDFLSDFKAVYHAELEKSFDFQPHTIIRSKRDFTDALVDYAVKNDLNIIITKEGMYPEFTLDEVEYIAGCVTSRFGSTIKCRMKYPEEIEPGHISKKKRKRYRMLIDIGSGFFIFLLISLIFYRDDSLLSMAVSFLCALAATVIWMAVIRSRYNWP